MSFKPRRSANFGLSEARRVCGTLRANGYPCFMVGGAVRDMVMGHDPKDIDIATQATPQQVKKLFSEVHPTGEKYGTVTVMMNGLPIEVTTFRSERGTLDRRHPENISFSDTIAEDLARRDFTINALAYDLDTGEYIDPYGGINDIKHGVIKAVGNPEERFKEDALRMMRAVRFQSRLGFKIDPKTESAIRDNARLINDVSKERVRDELVGIIRSPRPSVGLDSLLNTGLMGEILPELKQAVGVEQPKQYHKYDVYNHVTHVIDELPKDDVELRLAAMFHDIAKPAVAKYDPEKGRVMFVGHEDVGETITQQIMRRLRFPVDIIDRVSRLVKEHMFREELGDMSDAAIRRWVNKVGHENVAYLIALKRADCAASNRDCKKEMDKLEKRVSELKSPVVNRRTLAISGNDVMALTGLKPGPEIGRVLRRLEQVVMDNPEYNTRDKLVSLLGEEE